MNTFFQPETNYKLQILLCSDIVQWNLQRKIRENGEEKSVASGNLKEYKKKTKLADEITSSYWSRYEMIGK